MCKRGTKRRQTRPWLWRALDKDKDGAEPVGTRGVVDIGGVRPPSAVSRTRMQATGAPVKWHL
jgi:hypothetical protein